MVTPLVRPVATATVAGESLDVSDGDVSLDASRVPYGQASIDVPLVSPEVVELLDPRDELRALVVGGDGLAGTSREFDLTVRARTVDHKSKTIRLGLATDEALLMDYAPIVRDVGAFAHQSSMRGVIDYVLAKIGASLEAGVLDADVTTYTDATNMLQNPGTEQTTPAGTYTASGCSIDYNHSLWSISYDGDSFSLWNPTSADSFMTVEGATGTLLSGLTPGDTYVFSGTGNVEIATSGSLTTDTADAGGQPNKSRTRALVVHTRVGTGSYGIWHSPQVPNTPNTPTRVAVEFTVPEGATEVFLRAYLGATTGAIRWDGFRLTKKDPRPGADNTDFFSGDTPDTDAYSYEWTGAIDGSKSTRTALIARAPELLIWEPGVSAWDFLAPITATAGYRLFCDEQRVWRLIDPADYTITGVVSIAGHNATEGSDRIDLGDPNIYCTGVVVKYRWQDPEGNERRATDAAGEPGIVLVWNYERPYPGPGAAAAILARRQGAGRVQEVTALADWTVTPSSEASIILPATVQQIGTLRSVSWDIRTGLMRVATSGLLDALPGSWLAWNPVERWEYVDPDLTWEDI